MRVDCLCAGSGDRWRWAVERGFGSQACFSSALALGAHDSSRGSFSLGGLAGFMDRA